ncbi:SCHIP1 protein, partial [Aphelenchoides avenae]
MAVAARRGPPPEMLCYDERPSPSSETPRSLVSTVPKKETRVTLVKKTIPQLREILRQRMTDVQDANALLMQLLVERDALHMEQDGMLVDLEDLV